MSRPLIFSSENTTTTSTTTMSTTSDQHSSKAGTNSSSHAPSSPSHVSKSASSPTSVASHPSTNVTSAHGNHTAGSGNYTAGTTGAHLTSPHQGDPNGAGTTVAILITVGIILVFVVIVLYYLKKKGKLRYLSGFHPLRTRRSSTTDSTHVLPQSDHTDSGQDMKHTRYRGDRDDMNFTIEDTEEQGGRDEYFYDEVFGQSEFEDERTNSSVRELYSVADENRDDDEMLDFDFETLGIKIEDYKIGDGRDGRTATF